MNVTIDKYSETFWVHDGEAFVNGYTSDGEIFFIKVPKEHRRQGVAKRLLAKAEEVLRGYGHARLKFTSATSPEGRALLAWYEGSKT